jgi:hypothetical protein
MQGIQNRAVLRLYTNNFVKFGVNPNPQCFKPPVTVFRRPNHTISEQGRSRIKRYIDFIDDTASVKHIKSKELNREFNYKLGFLTLTLPGNQLTIFGQNLLKKFCKNKYCRPHFTDIPNVLRYDDNTIKHFLLNQFLTELRTRFDVSVYLWKAETQDNGNIHFHIIINKFIYYIFLRNTWNRICNKLHLIDEFYEKYNHREPNSIDIHSIRRIHNLKKYFTKYLLKSDLGRRKVLGKLWGCSTYVSAWKGVRIELEGEKYLEYLKYDEIFKGRVYYGDFFKLFKLCPVEISFYFPNSLILQEFKKKMLSDYNVNVNLS